MRFAIIFIALAALACSKKEQAPSQAEPSTATQTPVDSEGAGSDVKVLDDAEKQRLAEETEKLGKELAAELASANEDLPEALRGETPALGKPATIELVEPGKEPRETLRFAIAPGFEQKAKIDVGMTNQAVIGMLGVGNPEYVVSFALSMRAGKPEKNGLAPVTFTVDDAQIDPAMLGDDEKTVQAFAQALETARKLRGSYALGPAGRVADLRVEVPEKASKHAQDMADNLRLAILGLTPALPEQPVGKGASWTAHEAIEQAGARVNQLRTFELVSRDGDAAELKVSVRQTAAGQPWESQGTKYELETFKGTAHGELSWGSATLVPSAADLDSEVIKGLRYTSSDGRVAGVAVKVDRTVNVGGKK